MKKHLTNEFKYLCLTSLEGRTDAPLMAVFQSKTEEILLSKDVLHTVAEKRYGLEAVCLVDQVEKALGEFPSPFPET